MIVLNDLIQGGDEWMEHRRACVTASRFKDIVTPAKAELSKSSDKYMYELIAEKMGAKTESFSNEWMARGNELEPEARAVYSLISGNDVYEVGMIKTDDEKIGISPDGLIGEEGGVEIKCPSSPIHIKYLIDGKLPTIHKPQVMGSLWISGRKWWDFMSFHPELKPFIIRVERDEEYIKLMEKHILEFVEKMDRVYRGLDENQSN